MEEDLWLHLKIKIELLTLTLVCIKSLNKQDKFSKVFTDNN